MIPDPFKKTVKIPVRIIDGKINPFYGKTLPKIDNAIGDLVIPYYSLVDPAEACDLSIEETSEILPKGSLLMINLRVDQPGRGVLTTQKDPNVSLPTAPTAPKDGFVRVVLKEPLRLWHRGTKSSVLCPCECELPDLEEKAASINHAYTIASRKFETKRISNTGNVFRHVYHNRNGCWEQLDWLRERFDAQFEQKHFDVSTAIRLSAGFQANLFGDDQPVPENDPVVPDDLSMLDRIADSGNAVSAGVQTRAARGIDQHIPDGLTPKGFDKIMAEGWFHYNNRFWRYSDNEGILTIPLRIRLANFKLSKSQKRVLRLNADLDFRESQLKRVGAGECELFRRHRTRLGLSAPEQVALPNKSALNRTLRVCQGNQLIAASYLEIGATSSYGYYAIFEPEIEWRSLGIFTMLKEIDYSIATGKEFYYLGYAYEIPTILDYKKRFHGLESYDWHGEWNPFPRLK